MSINILAAAVEIDQILPTPPKFVINHFIQQRRIRAYHRAYSKKIGNLRENPFLVHRPLKSGII